MKSHKKYTVDYRRKRNGKTDYKKRLRILLAEKPRLVVRRSSKNILGQIIDYDGKGDKVLVSVSSKELGKMGWNFSGSNLPSAYLAGFLIAKKAAQKKIKSVVFDIGMCPPVKASRVFGFLRGAVDGDLDVPYSEEILPSEERVKGKHIADYAKMLKDNKAKYDKQFSSCLKKKAVPEDIEKEFDAVKKKIEAIK